jgi:hypothetical protein
LAERAALREAEMDTREGRRMVAEEDARVAEVGPTPPRPPVEMWRVRVRERLQHGIRGSVLLRADGLHHRHPGRTGSGGAAPVQARRPGDPTPSRPATMTTLARTFVGVIKGGVVTVEVDRRPNAIGRLSELPKPPGAPTPEPPARRG